METTMVNATVGFSVQGAVLRNLIESVSFACDREAISRPLGGPMLRFKSNGTVTAFATDGRRMAIRTVPVAECNLDLDVVLSADDTDQLCRIGRTAGMVRIDATDGSNEPYHDTIPDYPVIFSWKQRNGAREVIVDQPGGRFPDCRRFVRTEGDLKESSPYVLHCVANSNTDDSFDAVQVDQHGAFIREPAPLKVDRTEGEHIGVSLDFGLLRQFSDTIESGHRFRIYVQSTTEPIYCFDATGRTYVLMPLNPIKKRGNR